MAERHATVMHTSAPSPVSAFDPGSGGSPTGLLGHAMDGDVSVDDKICCKLVDS